MLNGILATTEQDRMFTNLETHQTFALERVAAIATKLHEPLRQWFTVNREISQLEWLYRPYLLLFKREFSSSVVARLWDSFFAAEKPHSFPRFFLAAILILLFPKLMLATNGSIEEVISLSDESIRDIDGLAALNLAIALEERISGEGNEWIYDNLPENTLWRDYSPKLFQIPSL
jgi:hypothetical protein